MTEQEKENERLNAYTFTEYSWFVGNYNDPAFYDKNQLTNEAIGIEQHGDEGGYDRQVYKKGQKISGGWQQKYRFKYEDKNFPGQELIPSSEISKDNSQLWMAFEKGGVCGAIAKTAENVSGRFRPARNRLRPTGSRRLPSLRTGQRQDVRWQNRDENGLHRPKRCIWLAGHQYARS